MDDWPQDQAARCVQFLPRLRFRPYGVTHELVSAGPIWLWSGGIPRCG